MFDRNNKQVNQSKHYLDEVRKIDCDCYFVYRPETGKSGNKFVYVTKAPPIENIVFSGGGAKGTVYGGVIRALEEKRNGVSVKDLTRNVAGSSIGAMTAAFFAGGIAERDIHKVLHDTNLPALIGTPYKPVHKKAGALLNFMRNCLQENLKRLYPTVKAIEECTGYGNLTEKERQSIRALITDNLPLTFYMLRILTKLDRARFKDLSVTAVNRESGKVFVFNADNSPDLEIAIACRASCSLPIVLEKVTIEKRLLKINEPGVLTFVDGGYFNNIPFDVVDNKQAKIHGINIGEQGQNLQTLVFLFDESSLKSNPDGQSPFYKADTSHHQPIYNPGMFAKFFRNTISSVLGGIKVNDMTAVSSKELQFQQVKAQFTQRNIPLKTLGITTMDFKKASNWFPSLVDTGYQQTREYLDNHENEACYYSFDNAASMLEFMPLEKLSVLCRDEAQQKFFAERCHVDILQIEANRCAAGNRIMHKM